MNFDLQRICLCSMNRIPYYTTQGIDLLIVDTGLVAGSAGWLELELDMAVGVDEVLGHTAVCPRTLCSARTVAVLLEQSFRCEIIISVFGRLVEASRQMRSRMAL